MFTLLTGVHPLSVTIMSIGALRMYRGLLDCVALNNPQVVRRVDDARRPSTIRLAPLDRREENRRNTGGPMLDPCPITSPKRISSTMTMRQDDGSFGTETA
jgi:hypothetical protein